MEQDKKTINIPYGEYAELQRCTDIIKSNEIRISLGDALRSRILVEGINKDTLDADAPDVFNKFINIIKEESKRCSDETDKLAMMQEERFTHRYMFQNKYALQEERTRLNKRSEGMEREIREISDNIELSFKKEINKINSMYKTYKALFWCTSIVFAITVYNLL